MKIFLKVVQLKHYVLFVFFASWIIFPKIFYKLEMINFYIFFELFGLIGYLIWIMVTLSFLIQLLNIKRINIPRVFKIKYLNIIFLYIIVFSIVQVFNEFIILGTFNIISKLQLTNVIFSFFQNYILVTSILFVFSWIYCLIFFSICFLKATLNSKINTENILFTIFKLFIIPIGIWYLQPKMNELYEEYLNLNSNVNNKI
jgi:hypothetical protein